MTKSSAFAAEQDFWEEYVKFRPKYPDELFDIIYEYHSLHSPGTNAWAIAHDVGSGVGIAGLELSRRFSHVMISDPSASNIETAKSYLARNSEGSKFSFFTSGAEKIADMVEKGCVDLLASAEAIMWAEHDETMVGAAEMTKPGGTLAFWSYHARPYFIGWDTKHADLQEKLHAVYERYIRIIFDFVDITVPHVHLMSNMDTWALDPGDWTNVRRIHWNRPDIDSPGLSAVMESAPQMSSRVRSSEVVENHAQDIFICEEVDYDWLEQYYTRIYPGIEPQTHLRDEMSALKRAFESKDKVSLGFPATLLLATRRL